MKDLRVFSHIPLKDIILVDNAVYSFGFQLDNGIPIFPYIQGKDDLQLQYLKEYLSLIVNKDVQRDLKKTFGMTSMIEEDLEDLADIYECPDNLEEDNFNILDQMFKDKLRPFRQKGHSFTEVYVCKNNFAIPEELGAKSNVTEENKVSDPSVNTDEFVRSKSNNEEFQENFNLIDSKEIDSLVDIIADANSFHPTSDIKHKKKKRVKLCMNKKYQSVYHRNEKKLDTEGENSSGLKDGNSSN